MAFVSRQGEAPPGCDARDDADSEQFVLRVAVARVLDLEGRTVRVRDFWRDSVTVTAFVRHFGCLFCHQMVEDLVVAVPEVLGRQARVVIVGTGSVEQARRFFASKNLPREGVTVLTDPDRRSYDAAGFERGVVRTFNAGSARAYARARSEGHRITGLFGDLTQLGGILVVQPPARLLYSHRSRFAGDHPDIAELLAALSPG